ncbi:MAG: double-strand break repair protein AddB [Alphaproteobacteria bacterium]|nr:MAG: double-strand break repair protein AddB [Alphaproteobacteria bacterium]
MAQDADNAPGTPPPDKTAGSASRIFTIAPDKSFLDSVAGGILAQVGNDPLKLSDYTILVPDRATRDLLRQAFMEQSKGKPGIMPRIDAPGDMDDDDLSLKISDNHILSQALMDIPQAVPELHRQLILAQEILKIPGMASSVQKAIKLGGELGSFLDEIQRNNLDLQKASSFVPAEFKDQWAHTAEFLKILTETWPKELQKLGMVDPEDHKNALISIQAAHWKQHPPANPIVAVGFTDTSPAVLGLLQTVAGLPKGAVVLPGVDLQLDQKSWDVLTPVHPQYAFKQMLTAFGLDRAAVSEWSDNVPDPQHVRANDLEKTNRERQKLLRETMRPAGTSEGWSGLKGRKKAKRPHIDAEDEEAIDIEALSGMDLITCSSQQEEASVIALKMRESLEVPGRTATLVTGDRSLARRVAARLRYWRIDVEDGAGETLSETPAGVFLLATANMAAEEWAPVATLEALKHPLATLGETHEAFAQKLSVLEDMVFHGPRPGPGHEGVKGVLKAAFNRAARRPDHRPLADLNADKQKLDAWLDAIEAAGKPLFDKMSEGKTLPFAEFLDDHIRFAEALAKTADETGADRLWRGDDGVKAARFLTQLRDAAKYIPDLTGEDYVDVLQGLMRDVSLKSTSAPHPTLKILTPEQARLTKADIMIVGGINDESWPKRPDESPWLSPDMGKALGLPPAEAQIGHAAHQFVQATSNPNVLLSRSVRSGDAPTVASPFLTRLMMVLKGANLDQEIQSKTQLLEIHDAMQTPADVKPIAPPEPRPPSSARPKELPVTAIEKLMRDPYAVYAKYVLKLRPKTPLDASPSVAERGTFTHDALDTFVKKYPDKLPDNAYDELLKIGRESFETRINNPNVQAFWWPRFERIAKWFVKFEEERREMTRTLGTEVRGKLEIDMGGGEVFTLTTIADRVDRNSDDQLAVIDYKTGAVPTQKSVALGYSPQLTLEALIAFRGGFDKIDASEVGELQYWKLSGGKPAADVTKVRGDVKQLVTEANEGIQNLVKAFNDSKTPYLSTPRPEWAPRYNDYKHLSRSGEWGTVKQQADAKKKLKKPKTQKPKPKRHGRGGHK